MMIRYNVKNIMRKIEYHVFFFKNAPSWNNPIQSNWESCISETTMAHYHMVLHGMVRYCMVLYGTVPMVLHGNNCMVLYALFPKQTSFNPMHQTFFSMMVPSFSHYCSSFLFTEKSNRAKFPRDTNFDF